MSECRVVREQMPLLLTESLDSVGRELTHLHIEQCAACQAEWAQTRETWSMLGRLPEVPLPARVRAEFLENLAPQLGANVIPFRRRPVAKWIAQAATVAVLTGGAFFAGRGLQPDQPASEIAAQARPAAAFRIAESAVVPASAINPDIEGQPDIRNVRFYEADPTSGEIGVAFDLTSRVTVTGSPREKNLVKLVSHFLRDEGNSSVARSSAIQWVREQYAMGASPDPELVNALASVVKNDTHEGVRIKAVDALRAIPAGNFPEVTQALVEALKNDPNPAVRIKAVDALSTLARSNSTVDPSMLDTLREKASQNDENTYVRVKAAEALSQLNL